MNIVLEQVFDKLGMCGVMKLTFALSAEDANNHRIAEEFDLSLWEVRVCGQFLSVLYNRVLSEKVKSVNRSAVILPFARKAG